MVINNSEILRIFPERNIVNFTDIIFFVKGIGNDFLALEIKNAIIVFFYTFRVGYFAVRMN